MSDGRQWLALDADMFGKRFVHDLYDQFGWAGVAVWTAFLCACKQSRRPGRVRMLNDLDGMVKLGIAEWDLVDNKGQAWSLTEFFDFTGRKKQTRRVAVQRTNSRRTGDGRVRDVCATHWGHWQNRTSHRKNGGPEGPPRARADLDLDSDNPPTPRKAGGSGRRFASNGKPPTPTPDPPRPPVPDWQPEPEPDDVVDRSALESFRAEKGWAKPEQP